MPVKTGPKLLRDRLIFSFLAQHHAPSVGGSSLFHGNTTNSGKPTPEATTGWEATASRSSEDSTGSKTGLWPLLRALAQCSPERSNRGLRGLEPRKEPDARETFLLEHSRHSFSP